MLNHDYQLTFLFRRPNIAALAEVLTEFNELNNRLQPHMQRFTEIVRSDAEMNAQVIFLFDHFNIIQMVM